MIEFIGVKPQVEIVHNFSSLKRDALAFNRIAIPNCVYLLFGNYLDDKHVKNKTKLADEFEWLFEKGIIFDPLELLADKDFPVIEDRDKMIEEIIQLGEAMSAILDN